MEHNLRPYLTFRRPSQWGRNRTPDRTVFGSATPVRYSTQNAMMLLELAGFLSHYLEEERLGNADRLDGIPVLCRGARSLGDRGHCLDRPQAEGPSAGACADTWSRPSAAG